MKNRRFTTNDIEKLPEWAQRQIKAQLNTARNPDTKPEQDKLSTLDEKAPPKTGMVNITGPVLVRITRRGPRRLDDDNLSGGCKELRDAIAAMLGRKDDSEAGQMQWEYKQETGKPETKIEVYSTGRFNHTEAMVGDFEEKNGHRHVSDIKRNSVALNGSSGAAILETQQGKEATK